MWTDEERAHIRHALDLLTKHSLFEPKSILRIDPPWPGCAAPFKHTLDDEQWARLFNGLLDLPDDIDFIISLGSERKALELVAQYMPHAPLYWRMSGLYVRSIVCLSPRLARAYPSPGLGERINLQALGL